MKKIIPILAASLLFQSFSGLSIAQAEESSSHVIYSFDNDEQGWQLGTSTGNPSLDYEVDGGNGYLKLKATAGASYKMKDGIDVVPNAFVELENPFKIEADSETVISIDVRTSDINTFVRGFMLNRDQLADDEAVKNELQYSHATLWTWNKSNVVSTCEKNNAKQYGPYYGIKTTKIATGILENNTWYTFKTTLYSNENGYPEALKVQIYRGETLKAESEISAIETETLKLSDRITRLDLALMHSNITVSENGADVDFDNVKIYKVSDKRTWGIAGLPENGIFTNAERIGVTFSGEMDESTLNDTNIKLFKDGSEVEYQGSYDKASYTYIMVPENMTSGKYSVVVDKNAISGLDESGNPILGLDENSKDKIEFTNFVGSIPEVKNVKVSGRLKVKSVLKATADYYQAEDYDGYLEYQWYYADTEDGTYSQIKKATENEYTVSAEYAEKFIKCAVVPVTNEGVKGEKVYSDVIRPLKKPEANNVEITGIATTGLQLAVSYDFYDENGDDEGETEFIWFASENGTDTWTQIEDENSFYLTVDDSLEGKYIKACVIPVSEDEPYFGNTYETDVVGPVSGRDSINLAQNLGFEDGTNKGWTVRNHGGDSATIVATQEDAYSGEWSGKLSGQTSNSTLLKNNVSVKKGIKYISSTMVKVAPDSLKDSAVMQYYGDGNPTGSTRENVESPTATKEEWKQVIALTVPGGNTDKYAIMPQYWAEASGKGAVFYYDDFYFAPLLIDDVRVKAPEKMNVPENGEVSSSISISSIVNQLGTTHGLDVENAAIEEMGVKDTVSWDVDAKGVYVKENKLYVTSEAVSGTINLKVIVKPEFTGAVQSIYVKNIPIELVANSNKTPKVTDVSLSGETALGSEVKLSYKFYQVNGFGDESIIEWYVADTENGNYKKLDGFSGLSLNITSEHENKFFKVEITPVDSDGGSGSKVTTNIAGPARKPEAKNVSATGKGFVGDVLKGSYEYYDFNMDEQGETVIKWLKADSKNGKYSAIPGANALEYTVKESDIGCWFKLEVTPVSQIKPCDGEAVLSDALQGPTAPTVTDVEIVKSGKILTGKYKFSSVNGVEEGETVCEWLIDGRVIQKGTSYTISFTGTKNVEFRVTPVAVSKPFEGESVSTSMKISNGSVSSGGGGGGGSKVSSAILPPLPQTQPEEQKPAEGNSDIVGHWSESYAREAVEKGIMTVDSQKNFYPDKMVTRAEMITYIFRAVGYSETEYRNEFQDVSASDSFAKMLQTMVDKGVISKDTNFRPHDNVTRQEVCKILSIALGLTDSEFDLNKYSDKDSIGDWAVPYVKNIINSKLMTGVSETVFSPRTNITNGQIAKIVTMISSGNNNNNVPSGNQSANQSGNQKVDLTSDEIKVAFIGGSLTQGGKEWLEMTVAALKEKMNGKNISYINMGLGGTGSGYGSCRYEHDVLEFNPDIVFIDFAINDKGQTGDAHSLYMEEMVRQSLRWEKVPAIIFVYTPDPTGIVNEDLEKWQIGVDYKEKLAEHYGIKSVNISEYMLWDIEQQGIDKAKYINEYYKSTGGSSWDVHGGYVKYGEALVKAINEDFESFLMLPKNAEAYHEENKTDVYYSVIPAVSDKITYTGNWTKCIEGEFKEFDDNSKIKEEQFWYFNGALMQTLKGDTSFEFVTDAEAVKLQYISSKAGNNAKVYVDGVETGNASTFSVNAGMNYDTPWIALPDDGKEHTVKYVIESPTSENYVYTFGSIIERRK